MALITVTNLVHRYGGQAVLELPSWQVEAGKHRLVLGPSGSGKSTLLAVLAGMLLPTGGTVMVQGEDLTKLSRSARDRLRARSVGLVMQRLHLIPAVTVRDNLRLAQTLAGLPADDERIGSVLSGLGVRDKADNRPAQLSVGEAQRVAIARAVVNKPAVILADEPTSALDDASCDAALDLLTRQAEENGATLIIATHDGRVKSRFPDRLELPGRVSPTAKVAA